jgi:hypothetical protein
VDARRHGGVDAVRKFYAASGIWQLGSISSANSSNALGVIGLPTKLLIDHDGREIGRFIGAADWRCRQQSNSSISLSHARKLR